MSRLPIRYAVYLLLPTAIFLTHHPRLGAQEAEERTTDTESTSQASVEGDTEEIRSDVQEWRDTLLYGINSEIVQLVPELTDNDEAELAPEVTALFTSSNDDDVLRVGAEYLRKMDVREGHQRALRILNEYESRDRKSVV